MTLQQLRVYNKTKQWINFRFYHHAGGVCVFHHLTPTATPKKRTQFYGFLKKGDRVITKSGMHGKIAELNDKDDTCVVETLAGKIKMERSSVSLELSQKLQSKGKK